MDLHKCIKVAECLMQESRETLFRLQRMAGFESQNFDPQVLHHILASSCPVPILQLAIMLSDMKAACKPALHCTALSCLQVCVEHTSARCCAVACTHLNNLQTFRPLTELMCSVPDECTVSNMVSAAGQ